MPPSYYVPLTVGAAKAAGWIALGAHCPGHHTTEAPWSLIEADDDRLLASIVKRPAMRRCGKPPTEVYLHRLVADMPPAPPRSVKLSIVHLVEP
jgi:hypothetical protein